MGVNVYKYIDNTNIIHFYGIAGDMLLIGSTI